GVTYSQLGTSGGVEQRMGGASGGTGYFNKSSICNPIVIGDPEFTPNGPQRLATDYGNAGLGIISGPGQVNFDVSILKNIPITERHKLQSRTEFFNIANHPVFQNPGVARNNANLFGVINSTVGNPRLIQFALKYNF